MQRTGKNVAMREATPEKSPTERQLMHLRENLFYDGPEPANSSEASQLIQSLHDSPATQLRRMYEHRIVDGPNWLIWEKWMLSSRKEYDRTQWQNWWDETQKLGLESGMIPLQIPPVPSKWRGSHYSTAEELLIEIREVLGIQINDPIQLEMSVGSVEEAIVVKDKIAKMREDLRLIGEDASWMLSRIRETTLGDPLIGQLFEENVGGSWSGVNLERDQFLVLKNTLLKLYTYIRGLTKNLNSQMRHYVKRVNEVYKK
jgi:hypothetical protein